MKLNIVKIIILFALFTLPLTCNCQSNISLYSFTFEDTTHQYFMYPDTVSNPNCIWQIGSPQKATFNNSTVNSNVIVTDTLNSYPINDTSSFIIKHEVGGGYLQYGVPVMQLSASYFVNSDSLNDFGKIEFSPDNGNSWILISEDTLNDGSGITWPNNDYFVLTGNSNGWKTLFIEMSTYDYSTFNSGDTVQYRFTFISDNNPESLDGLMFDNINVSDFAGGSIKEFSSFNVITYPNPFTTTINFNYNHLTEGKLFIYDMTGKLVHTETIKNTNSTTVNTSEFTKGIYFYKIVDSKTGLSVGSGKVVK